VEEEEKVGEEMGCQFRSIRKKKKRKEKQSKGKKRKGKAGQGAIPPIEIVLLLLRVGGVSPFFERFEVQRFTSMSQQRRLTSILL